MYLNNQEFTALVKAFQADQEPNKDAFAKALSLLADNLLTKYRFAGVMKADAIQECVYIGLIKAHRYDSKKGLAFNFFTTIMLNHCRQLYRTEANYVKLKQRYTDKLRREQGQEKRRGY